MKITREQIKSLVKKALQESFPSAGKPETWHYNVGISGAERFNITGTVETRSKEEAEAVARAHISLVMKEVRKKSPKAFGGELTLTKR